MPDESRRDDILDARRQDYRRARQALWRPQYRKWLANNLPAEIWAVVAGGAIAPVVAAAVTWWLWPDKAPASLGEAALPALLVGIIGAVAGLLALLAFKAVGMRLAAPANLWIADQQTIKRLSAEVATNAEAGNVDNVKRRVRDALHGLFETYRELEIVANRTNEDAWERLSQRLDEYRSAYALLPPTARRFHERSVPALAHFIRNREFDRLYACMNDASDIMLNGECELDLTISQPTPIVITNRTSRRSRFIILNITIGNREDTTVSLYPVWHLLLDPGRVHMVYQADAEPLQDWEEQRRQIPRPANPPLPMPLVLQPHSAATGYWCFFFGDELENEKRLQDGRRYVETVLEIHDLASDRRTKSDRIHLEIDLVRMLVSPLHTGQAEGGD